MDSIIAQAQGRRNSDFQTAAPHHLISGSNYFLTLF